LASCIHHVSNSSDVFFLPKNKTGWFWGYIRNWAFTFFIILIYALFSFSDCILADKVGMKTNFYYRLLVFCYSVFWYGCKHKSVFLFWLFFSLRNYAFSYRGISKAWILTFTDKKDTATAIGTFTGFQAFVLYGKLTYWYYLV